MVVLEGAGAGRGTVKALCLTLLYISYTASCHRLFPLPTVICHFESNQYPQELLSFHRLTLSLHISYAKSKGSYQFIIDMLESNGKGHQTVSEKPEKSSAMRSETVSSGSFTNKARH